VNNIYKQLLFLIFNIFLTISITAQLIVTQPSFPLDSDSIVITFNSAEGSAGLANYNGDVYLHTGVITNQSTSPSDWKYVKTNWGENTPATKMTKIGNNLYQIKLSPDIRSYYSVPSSEKIEKIAIVFRSDVAVGGSYLEGKTADGSDIFIDVYEPGLQLSMNKPAGGFALVEFNDTFIVNLTATYADSVFLFVNGVLSKSDTGNVLVDTVIANQYNRLWIKAQAKDAANSIVADSFYLFVREPVSIEPLPTGIKEGINYINNSTVVLCLYAPEKSFAFVLGDFNDWSLDSAFYMKQTPDSNYFWLEISNLVDTTEYIFQYLIDGEIKVGDPYAEKVSDPWNDSYISDATYPNMLVYPKNKTSGIATVLQIKQKEYNWITTNFTPPREKDLVVYELLVRDFMEAHTFEAVIDSLHYLKSLGINAIELMPVNEFEGNSSWGYNPNYYFAVDKYYGTKNSLKKLIDICHQNGIAVILDVVYNHSFGTSPYVMMWWDKANNRPAPNNPFFNSIPKHDFNVGFDFNHESIATKKYISRALKFWLDEFRIDGYRFDLSKGFTQKNSLGNVSLWGQYDPSRINILNSYVDTIWSVNPKAYVILEHFADNSEEKTLSNRGFMLWGNSNYNYNEAAMGYFDSGKSDFSWISYKERGWSQPKVMGYMESHDEERLMYKCSQWGNTNGSYSIKEVKTYMQRASLDAMFFLTIPGPKMIWQFGELGYDISIDFNGRTGEKPIKWDYMQSNDRYNTYLVYSALNKLRTEESNCFQTADFDLNVSGKIKTIVLKDTSMNAVVVGNFDVEYDTLTMFFPHSGKWYDYLSGKEIEVKNNKFLFYLRAGEYHMLIDKKKDVPQWIIQPMNIIVDELKFEGKMEIMPNPNDGNFYIFIDSENDVELSFYDISGKSIGTFKVSGGEKRRVNVNDYTMNFRSGFYFCKMYDGEKIVTKKFIVL